MKDRCGHVVETEDGKIDVIFLLKSLMANFVKKKNPTYDFMANFVISIFSNEKLLQFSKTKVVMYSLLPFSPSALYSNFVYTHVEC
jgi:hypothetical protein